METRTEWYESRAELERGVESLSDGGWVLGRIARVSERAIRGDFVRRSSMVSGGPPDGPDRDQ